MGLEVKAPLDRMLGDRDLLSDLAAHADSGRTWLASFRGFHCLTLRELAVKAGCSYETLRNLEKGKRTRDHVLLLRIGEVLSVPFNLLFKDDDYVPQCGTLYYRARLMEETIPEKFHSNLEVVQTIIEKGRVRDTVQKRKRVQVFDSFPARSPGKRNRDVHSLLFHLFGTTEDLSFSGSKDELYAHLRTIMISTGMKAVEMDYIDAFWIQKMSQTEVGVMTGRSNVAVCLRLNRAYRKLRHPSRSRAVYYVIHGWDVGVALERASQWLTDVDWRVDENEE